MREQFGEEHIFGPPLQREKNRAVGMGDPWWRTAARPAIRESEFALNWRAIRTWRTISAAASKGLVLERASGEECKVLRAFFSSLS